MVRNRAWNKYETLLLVEYSSKVLRHDINKSEAISELSYVLRKRAIQAGEEIDSSFRNENGISMQMAKMIPLLRHNKGSLSNPPQVFYDMVELYESCNKIYDILLRIAKGEEEHTMSLQEQFYSWLSDNVPVSQLAGIMDALHEVDSFCLGKKIIRAPLLEIADLDTIHRILETVASNKVFRFTHITTYNKCRLAITHYYHFLKYYNETLEKAHFLPDAAQSVPCQDEHNGITSQEVVENKRIGSDASAISGGVSTEQVEDTEFNRQEVTDEEENRCVSGAIDKLSDTSEAPSEETSKAEISPVCAEMKTFVKDAAYFREAFSKVKLHKSKEDLICDALRSETEDNTYGTTIDFISSNTSVAKAYVKSVLSSVPWCIQRYGKYMYVQPKEESPHVVSFNFTGSYGGTHPVSVTYFEESIKEKFTSWSEVYFEVLRVLAEDYPDVFRDIAHGSDSVRIGIVDLEQRSLVKRSVEFMDGICASIPIAATKIIGKIKNLLELCNVDEENLIITYTYRTANTDGPDKEQQELLNCSTDDSNVVAVLEYYKVPFKVYGEYLYVERDKLSTMILRRIRANDHVQSVESVMRYGSAHWRIKTHESNDFNNSDHVEQQPEVAPPAVKERKYLVEQRENFYVWLRDIQGYSQPTCRSYVSAVKTAEQYAREHSHLHTKLFVEDFDEVNATATFLLNDAAFMALNASQHNRFSAAITQYLSFMSYYTNSNGEIVFKEAGDKEAPTEQPKSSQCNDARYLELLSSKFENGFRPNSAIDKNRFKVFYQESFGEPLDANDEQIVRKLEKLGDFRDGRIFAKADAEQTDLLSEILNTIQAAFNAGASCVYIEPLFARYQEQLAEQLQVFNGEALRDLILSNSRGYFARFAYIGCFKVNPDTEKDVTDYMKRSHAPVNYNALEKDLWFIPLDKIKHILVTNKSMVNVAQETYYYAPNLPVSSSEVEQIADLIDNELLQKRFVSGPELYELIQSHCPSVAINTTDFTSWGLRNALGYLLRDKFNFNGNIICAVGETMTTAQVFSEFCRCREAITTDELKEFANEMETVVYWDSVYDEAVRVSATDFVNKRNFHFDVDAIDDVLDELIDRYTSIPSVKLFLHFPPIQVQWNGFVLESFVQGYSRRFKLLHASYGAGDCCGAIVRRNAGINEYRDLVVAILAENRNWTTQMDALQILVDEGYQMRRALSGIDKMMTDAKHLRIATKE